MSDSTAENRHFREILLEKMRNFTKNQTHNTRLSVPDEGLSPLKKASSLKDPTDFSFKIYKFTDKNAKAYTLQRAKPPECNVTHNTKPPEANTVEAKYTVTSLSTPAQLTLFALGICNESQPVENTYVKVSEVKRAFRRMARKLHPDLNPTTNPFEFAEIKLSTDALLIELSKSQPIKKS